jgi:tetratricopeptide (TPR) repeat protein
VPIKWQNCAVAADPWDFFVSYTQADRAWAEWIAWNLEEDGYRVLVQAWDFIPGINWTQNMQDGVTGAARTIAVLSDAYLNSVYGSAEWQAAWAADPDGKQRKLLIIRVQDCPRPGLLTSVVGVDIFGKPELEAKSTLRKAVADALSGRAKPATAPRFPGRAVPRPARFPGALPTVWKVAARNPNFTGRDAALAALARDLSSRSTVTVHSVHGLGGVGKTQLAIEFAYTYASNYDVVWSITAEDPTTIPDQFAALARKLGLSPANDPDEMREQVHDALRAAAGWLLIFDNADSVAGIRPWLPSIPLQAGTPGHVIVTTRRGGFGSIGHVLDLDVIDLPAAVQLLRSRVPALDEDLAEQLADQLGRLPLGLEQAAAYLDRTQTPAAEYLNLLRTSTQVMLAEGVVHAHGHSLSTVWNLSLDRIAREAPEAMELLGICAYLAPEAIPLDLFTGHPDEIPTALAQAVASAVAFNKTVSTLVDYSLAKRTPAGLQLHRLVQAAVRLCHQNADQPPQPTSLQVALRLLRVDAPTKILRTPEAWPRWAVLLPHVRTAADHFATNSSVEGDNGTTAKAVSWLLDRTGTYLQVHARGREALPLFERALAIAELAYGPDHLEVADHLNSLGELLRDLGDPAGARPLHEHALAICETTYRPNHPDVAVSLNYLAVSLYDLGDLGGARPLFERALAIDEATYGPDDSQVAIDLINLAELLRDLGDPTSARPLNERALAIDEAIYGPDHPEVAIDLNNLALNLYDLGDPAAARPLIERALAIHETTYGPNHPNVATNLRILASILADLGELAAARPLAKRALAIDGATYGPNHPNTQASQRSVDQLTGSGEG